MKYEMGYLTPWWDDSFKELPYQYLPHKDTNMLDEWILQGYTNMNLNGAVHDIRHHTFAKKFNDFFNWANTGAALYQMNTGDVLPVHRDQYIIYQKALNITDPSVIWRAIVFMEDWKSGHYFEIDSTPVFNWRAGDYVMWNYDVPHMAANLGIEPRYTLQITGVRNVP